MLSCFSQLLRRGRQRCQEISGSPGEAHAAAAQCARWRHWKLGCTVATAAPSRCLPRPPQFNIGAINPCKNNPNYAMWFADANTETAREVLK